MSTHIDDNTNLYSVAIQNLISKSNDYLTKNPELFKID